MLEFSVVALALVWVIVLVQGAALVELLRQVTQLRALVPRQGAAILPTEGLTDGEAIPATDGVVSLAGTRLGDRLRNSVLLFLTAECATCRVIAPRISDLDIEVGVPVYAILHGRPQAIEQFVTEFALRRDRVVVDVDGAVGDAFRIKTTPSAVVVSDGAKWAHGIVNDVKQAAALHEVAIGRKEGMVAA